MSEIVERIARALMLVNAARPGNQLNGLEVPVLSLDPDFDDLPLDKTEGTEDDDLTQEAVLRLARAAIEAMRQPTGEMLMAAEPHEGADMTDENMHAAWQAMIDAALTGGK